MRDAPKIVRKSTTNDVIFGTSWAWCVFFRQVTSFLQHLREFHGTSFMNHGLNIVMAASRDDATWFFRVICWTDTSWGAHSPACWDQPDAAAWHSEINGGFHSHEATPQWMVCDGKSRKTPWKWMRTGGTPMTQETTSNVGRLLRPRCLVFATIWITKHADFGCTKLGKLYFGIPQTKRGEDFGD